MATGSEESFEEKGNDVVEAAGRLGAQTDELDDANASAQREPEEVGSWITAIGKALLAVIGFDTSGGT